MANEPMYCGGKPIVRWPPPKTREEISPQDKCKGNHCIPTCFWRRKTKLPEFLNDASFDLIHFALALIRIHLDDVSFWINQQCEDNLVHNGKRLFWYLRVTEVD
jgi:hypothetical protein